MIRKTCLTPTFMASSNSSCIPPQLKRAKLADTLSNQLQKRPGPLELVKKNILHLETEKADEEEEAAKSLEQAVREGQILFRPTIEGVPTKQGGHSMLLRVSSPQKRI